MAASEGLEFHIFKLDNTKLVSYPFKFPVKDKDSCGRSIYLCRKNPGDRLSEHYDAILPCLPGTQGVIEFPSSPTGYARVLEIPGDGWCAYTGTAEGLSYKPPFGEILKKFGLQKILRGEKVSKSSTDKVVTSEVVGGKGKEKLLR